MEPYVNHFEKDCIGYLEFGHPAANSLPSDLLEQLKQQLNLLSISKAVKVIVIQSGGDQTFSAGASFNEMKKIEKYRSRNCFFYGFCKPNK
jgi:methylglutaconyl-CoA hydratase